MANELKQAMGKGVITLVLRDFSTQNEHGIASTVQRTVTTNDMLKNDAELFISCIHGNASLQNLFISEVNGLTMKVVDWYEA